MTNPPVRLPKSLGSSGPVASRVTHHVKSAPGVRSTSQVKPASPLSFDGTTEHQVQRIGRYTLDALIAVGGMASVYLGSSSGAADFTRVVAIKRMHPQFAQDPEFVSRFRDEAWLCARLLHPSIVQTFDVVEWEHELLLIMEYVEGVTLHALRTDATLASSRFPVPVALGILVPVLHGLHAAHEATDDDGQPLRLVHRDFTPHNLLVSREGHAKVLDFGIAKACGQLHATSTGQLSGKYGYLSPEQIHVAALDRRADIFAAGIVLWETLTGERLFREQGLSDVGVLDRVLRKSIPAPSSRNPEVTPGLDAIALKALDRNPEARFETAREFALALEAELAPASPHKVAEFVAQVAGARLARLADLHASVRRRPSVPPRREPASLPEPADLTIEAAALQEGTHIRIQKRRRGSWWFLGVALLGAVTVFSLRDRLLDAQVRTEPARSSEVQPGARAVATSASGSAVESEAAVALDAAHARAASASPAQASTDRTPAPVNAAAPMNAAAPKRLGARARPAQESDRPLERRAAPAVVQENTSKRDKTSEDRCNPPTYVDAKGIRHFKEGCL